MLPDHRLVRSEINAIDLVACYVAMEPLNLGAHGNGANRLEPTRTGQIACATRGQAEADHADRSRQAAEDQRSPYPSAAVSSGGTRRPSDDPWITRTKIKPQVSRTVGAEHFA